eukprot:g46688.t1
MLIFVVLHTLMVCSARVLPYLRGEQDGESETVHWKPDLMQQGHNNSEQHDHKEEPKVDPWLDIAECTKTDKRCPGVSLAAHCVCLRFSEEHGMARGRDKHGHNAWRPPLGLALTIYWRHRAVAHLAGLDFRVVLDPEPLKPDEEEEEEEDHVEEEQGGAFQEEDEEMSSFIHLMPDSAPATHVTFPERLGLFCRHCLSGRAVLVRCLDVWAALRSRVQEESAVALERAMDRRQYEHEMALLARERDNEPMDAFANEPLDAPQLSMEKLKGQHQQEHPDEYFDFEPNDLLMVELCNEEVHLTAAKEKSGVSSGKFGPVAFSAHREIPADVKRIVYLHSRFSKTAQAASQQGLLSCEELAEARLKHIQLLRPDLAVLKYPRRGAAVTFWMIATAPNVLVCLGGLQTPLVGWALLASKGKVLVPLPRMLHKKPVAFLEQLQLASWTWLMGVPSLDVMKLRSATQPLQPQELLNWLRDN